MPKDVYISVDIETAGPVPNTHAILSIGACLVDDPSTSFYVELQPDRLDNEPKAMAISGLTFDYLREHGIAPQAAMQAFAVWLEKLTPVGTRPVFVALNAPFDWMFVNDYFHLYLGTNPFGHSALDIKAYYMGLAGVSWSETSFSHITAHLQMHIELEHNALHDAQDQAAIFHELMEISGRKHERNGVGPKE